MYVKNLIPHSPFPILRFSNSPVKIGRQVAGAWTQQKLPKCGFRTHTTALWPMEQFSILFAKFDCPVARQNCSLFATAHDCESSL